jgi:methionyl-tRNA formyltransferase
VSRLTAEANLPAGLPQGNSPARLRVIYAGTPAFAVPALDALIQTPGVEVVAVYTQPDRAAGRGRHLKQSEVKTCALAHGLLVRQPLSWRDPAVLEALRALDADLLVVAAYGLILPAESLVIPRLGSVNLHASLLPRWRGAAPVQRAIMAGDVITGITLMRVVPALDAGPMLATVKTPIAAEDTAGTLEARLAELGARLLLETLPALAAGTLQEAPQNPDEVTYASKITREDREIDWARPAVEIERRIRALQPAQQAATSLAGIPVSLLEATAIDATPHGAPGTLETINNAGIDIATGTGVLRITLLQPQGKRPVSARDFVNGYGARLRQAGT